MANKCLVDNEKAEALACINAYLDKMYEVTQGYEEFKDEIDTTDKIGNFVAGTVEEIDKYEALRMKITKDEELDLVEINLITLAFLFVIANFRDVSVAYQNKANDLLEIMENIKA